MTTAEGNPVEHDGAGNLTGLILGGTTLKYRHNPDGQLTEVLDGKAAYRYGGDGRLIARIAGGTETTFIPDPLATIWRPLVMEEKGGPRTLLIWQGTTPIMMIRDGKPEYLLQDHLGSVRLVVDGEGKVTRRIDHDPFGTMLDSAQANEFAPRFAGLFWDAEARAYLTFARAYQPELGQFLQIDPQQRIPAGSLNNLSTYSYSGGDPVNFVDRNGAARQRAQGELEDIHSKIIKLVDQQVRNNFSNKDTPGYLKCWQWQDLVFDALTTQGQQYHEWNVVPYGEKGGFLDKIKYFMVTGDLEVFNVHKTFYRHFFVVLQSKDDPNIAYKIDPWRGNPLTRFVFGVPKALISGQAAKPIPFEYDPNKHTKNIFGNPTRDGIYLSGTRPVRLGPGLLEPVDKTEFEPIQGMLGASFMASSVPLESAEFFELRDQKKPTPQSMRTFGGIDSDDDDSFGKCCPPPPFPPHFATVNREDVGSGHSGLRTDRNDENRDDGGNENGDRDNPRIQKGNRPPPPLHGNGKDNRTPPPPPPPGSGAVSAPASAGTTIRPKAATNGGGDKGLPEGALASTTGPAKRGGRGGGVTRPHSWPQRPGGPGKPPPGPQPPLGGKTPPGSSQSGAKNITRSALMSPSHVGGVYLSGAGQSLTGLGLLDGVALDANNNLVLVGKSGETLKLPPLRLDDVVTIFRSVYLHGEGPMVTIDPNPENPEGSAMIIRHGNATENTYVGWVLYQADRLMKGYTLGVDNATTQKVESTVPGYSGVLESIYFGGEDPEKLRKEGHWERFWIVPAEAKRFGGPRNELTLFEVPLKVKTQTMKWLNRELVDDHQAQSSPGALALTQWFTKNYEGIARERFLTPPPESGITEPVPIFTELRRIALMTAIAEKLRDQGIPMPFWMRDYEVRKIPFEKVTPGLLVTRSNQRVTARIYGGVQLSVSDKDVTSFTAESSLSSLPKAEQTSAREKLQLAASLEKALADKMTGAEPLEVVTIKDRTASYQAVALPGSDTQALAAARLEETDLAVPVKGDHMLTLVRSYNSFFDPKGPWGKGWALNLPRLDEIKVPVQRDEKSVQFRSAFELTTPLNDLYVRFSRVEDVPALNSRLQVPDQPGPFSGLADAKPAFLSGQTRQLIRKDGGIGHFSPSGELVATEQDGFKMVYERDQSAELTRLVGLLGKRPVGLIELHYDPNGRLESAKSKAGGQESTVRYEYDDVGRLAGVVSEAGRLGYRYEGPWVNAVTYREAGVNHEERTLRRFEYNARGQLTAEVDAGGARTEYRMTADAKGTAITAVPAGANASSESIQYDRALRPIRAEYPDGAQTTWHYPADGGVDVETADADGRKIRLAESADQRHRTLELAPNHKLAAEYTAAGQLASLAENGRTVLHQDWLPDGRLRLTGNELGAAHFGYDDNGLISNVMLTPPGAGDQFAQWQQIKLDPAGRPREITDYAGLEMNVGYDDAGRLSGIVRKQDGKNYGFELTRDASGRVEEIKSSWGKQRYTYDAAGLPAKLEMEQGNTKTLAEWKDGLLQTVKQLDGGQYSLTYYPDGKQKGLPKQITAPNGLALNYQYDDTNRLREVAVGTAYRLLLDYDDKGRLKEWRYQPGGP